ncbi:hypothetical protein LV779_34610 [Streptomyces thinghirensis]|nr:hypothetical protein [Streptomyces thinghirensis]
MRTFGDEALRGLALEERQGAPPSRAALRARRRRGAHRAPHGEVERLRRYSTAPAHARTHPAPAVRDAPRPRRRTPGQDRAPRPAPVRAWLAESHRLFAEAGPGLGAHDLDSAGCGASGGPTATADRRATTSARRPSWSSPASKPCRTSSPARARAPRSLFPGSSLSRVEGVYRGDPVVDYFNDRLSVLLADAVRAWGAAEPRAAAARPGGRRRDRRDQRQGPSGPRTVRRPHRRIPLHRSVQGIPVPRRGTPEAPLPARDHGPLQRRAPARAAGASTSAASTSSWPRTSCTPPPTSPARCATSRRPCERAACSSSTR